MNNNISYNQEKIINLDDGTLAWVDTNNKLMWEVKNKENISHTYFWEKGTHERTKEQFSQTIIDVFSYVEYLNKSQYCGYSDWRIPTIEELNTLKKMETTNNRILSTHSFISLSYPLHKNIYKYPKERVSRYTKNGDFDKNYTIHHDCIGYYSILEQEYKNYFFAPKAIGVLFCIGNYIEIGSNSTYFTPTSTEILDLYTIETNALRCVRNCNPYNKMHSKTEKEYWENVI